MPIVNTTPWYDIRSSYGTVTISSATSPIYTYYRPQEFRNMNMPGVTTTGTAFHQPKPPPPEPEPRTEEELLEFLAE